MQKNNKKVNSLIKKKGFVELMKEHGIKRTSKKGEKILKEILFEDLNKFLEDLKDKMSILGKRVLDEEVLLSYEKDKNRKEEVDY